jgi:hypothetical protein
MVSTDLLDGEKVKSVHVTYTIDDVLSTLMHINIADWEGFLLILRTLRRTRHGKSERDPEDHPYDPDH